MHPDHQIHLYPTDTVWGIGASLTSQRAHSKIATIKGHTPGKPLSILFARVEEVMQNFELPGFMDAAFLRELFSLEVTLGLPLSQAGIDIPPWIVGESSWVGVRCLEYPWVRDITERAGGPVSTTSLNLSGQAPCVDFSCAQTFLQTHCPDARLWRGDGQKLSGVSSTIVTLSDLSLLREGRHSAAIKKLFISKKRP